MSAVQTHAGSYIERLCVENKLTSPLLYWTDLVQIHLPLQKCYFKK